VLTQEGTDAITPRTSCSISHCTANGGSSRETTVVTEADEELKELELL
jgi:hypothetical protein